MKKVLFLESRYVTYLYDAIAEKLIKDGYQVYWIILNKQFKPENGTCLFTGFPNKNFKSQSTSEYLQTIIDTDRHLRFFEKKSTSHFHFYDLKIREQIKWLQPDIVFGEPTSFLHLMSIEVCRELDILYLHPTSCRYPVNRFAFYEYDTLQPYRGSGEIMETKDAQIVINQIAHRKSIPNYMVRPEITFKRNVEDKIKILKGYLEGERYNTPAPLVRLRKNNEIKNLLREWNDISTKVIDNSKFSVLFPLHMQPESSIDVWGRQYSDQNSTIRSISDQLGSNDILYVKPNPKSSFEINSELIQLVKQNKNIKALNSDISMSEIFSQINLFINIVGTISIECILSNKPVVSLVRTYFNDVKNSFIMSQFEDIKKFVELVKTNEVPKLNNKEKIGYINMLNSMSFNGVISDTYNNRNVTSEENIQNLYSAFQEILRRV